MGSLMGDDNPVENSSGAGQVEEYLLVNLDTGRVGGRRRMPLSEAGRANEEFNRAAADVRWIREADAA